MTSRRQARLHMRRHEGNFLIRAAVATLLKLEGREEVAVNPAKKKRSENAGDGWSRL